VGHVNLSKTCTARDCIKAVEKAYAIRFPGGNPEELLRIRESKIERARVLRRETNMKERNGGERAGTVS